MTETLEATAVNTVDLADPKQFAAATVPPAQELQRIPQQQTQAADPIMAMLQIVVQNGGDLEKMEKLLDLRARLRAEAALEAFTAAMAEFKKNPPVIVKDKHVHFDGAKGATDYDHATHYGVTSAIVSELAKYGISHRWDTDQKEGKIGITCVLTHVAGHSQATRLEAAHDSSGGKNGIQAIISAKSYLERHTLLAATGLSTKDQPDDDGRGTQQEISEADQVLDRLLIALGKTVTDRAALLVWKERNAELAKWAWAHNEFKVAVANHRNGLKAKAQAEGASA